ncbi:MAG: PadR family transcriptional regulator [Nanoarchaeota archaeon]|nr:PadR family transcriptional regulator [Nanoarchaeota archaeon]
MNKNLLGDGELNSIFSGIEDSQHILHLYSPSVNKYLIHASFFSDGKVAYITEEDPNLIVKKFNLLKADLSIISPHEVDKIKDCDRIIIDTDSINPELNMEKIRKSFNGQSVLCTYNISKLDPKKIKSLAKEYDKLILTSDNTTLLSSDSINTKRLINNDLIDEFVKKELKMIALALINKETMCGRDIKLEIYKNFNILISSGTLYPLLHELEKNKLIECHNEIKTKIYRPANKKIINKILNEHIQVKNFLSNFLQSSMIKEK